MCLTTITTYHQQTMIVVTFLEPKAHFTERFLRSAVDMLLNFMYGVCLTISDCSILISKGILFSYSSFCASSVSSVSRFFDFREIEVNCF